MLKRLLAFRGDDAVHYAVAEAREAIVRLTSGEKTKLLTVAKVYAKRSRSRYDYEELFSEAATRILEGKRPWPRSQMFLNFFCGVMKSIADSWRTVRRGYVEQKWDDTEVEAHQMREPPAGDAEESFELFQQFLRLFDDDKLAQDLLTRRLQGYSGEEAWMPLGITKTRYESTLKKIERRVKSWRLYGRSERGD
jgi:DNA-directed RNA polymerase specialized sigma24 family protein